jgi:hypothetical protein
MISQDCFYSQNKQNKLKIVIFKESNFINLAYGYSLIARFFIL